MPPLLVAPIPGSYSPITTGAPAYQGLQGDTLIYSVPTVGLGKAGSSGILGITVTVTDTTTGVVLQQQFGTGVVSGSEHHRRTFS